ncbi:DUF2325 domain-containing protein [Noviherbaspirillum sedimenti]|uniref:DUF2325 domain-containing protein n=2 Tax=Noviherbaspirillum sedimenti TaxID=2320865 RepID=A0A3A3FX02_9BURK|nr:DUF2325 domain-containing protein [Noviherbaspirillum sedimenti]
MCDHDAKQAFSLHFHAPGPGHDAAATTGSRRRRLWDLPQQCHCPVVGVCLPLETLSRLASKALGGKAIASDYEVHVGAVAECVQRNRLSELMQNELDRRYARKIRDFRSAKNTQALQDMWVEAVRQSDVSGAFWAALTHPRCDAVLQETLCRDMHMIQHQAGASLRTDITRFNALQHENGILTRELAKAQERATRIIAEKSTEIAHLTTQVFRVRAESIAKDSRIAFLTEDMAVLKASLPDLETITRLQKKIEQMALRQSTVDEQNARLRQELASARKLLAALPNDTSEAAKAVIAGHAEPCIVPVHLHHKTVLCVGGRNGSIASYRDIIERVGGRFAHHDGGLEDSPNVLDANLAAADLVICQTGCISHNAYWKVKDFCKRNGKRCVFVENPSATSLMRGLQQISATDSDIPATNDRSAPLMTTT